MTMLRRTAQGRLSELFGERTLAIDELIRRLDVYPLAAQSVEAQDDYTHQALRSYARGVNSWLQVINDEARGRGAPEFWLGMASDTDTLRSTFRKMQRFSLTCRA